MTSKYQCLTTNTHSSCLQVSDYVAVAVSHMSPKTLLGFRLNWQWLARDTFLGEIAEAERETDRRTHIHNSILSQVPSVASHWPKPVPMAKLKDKGQPCKDGDVE